MRTVGSGWTTVVVARFDPAGLTGGAASARGAKPGDAGGAGADAVAGLLGGLPKVSGDWGSGRLLTGKLFSGEPDRGSGRRRPAGPSIRVRRKGGVTRPASLGPAIGRAVSFSAQTQKEWLKPFLRSF